MGEPFKELKVWRLSRKLALEVYQLTREFPSEERYCLATQMRRAANAIAANISAEGNSRGHRGEYLQFCHYARGSLSELKSYLVLCADLEYSSATRRAHVCEIADEVGRMLQGLIAYLKSDT